MTEFSESDLDRQMVQSEDPKPSFEHYRKITSMMKGVESILSMLREKLVPGRKLQDTESQRLRDAYLTPAWGPTNIAFDEFVMGLFEKGLAADTAEVDAKWPMRDRFKQGAGKLFSIFIPELKA